MSERKRGIQTNDYYSPSFLAYFRKEMLPKVVIWTKICFNNLLKSSNASVENYFKYVKSEHDTNLPVTNFIQQYRERTKELAVEYGEEIIKGAGKFGVKENIDLVKIAQNDVDNNEVKLVTEKWEKRSKRFHPLSRINIQT